MSVFIIFINSRKNIFSWEIEIIIWLISTIVIIYIYIFIYIFKKQHKIFLNYFFLSYFYVFLTTERQRYASIEENKNCIPTVCMLNKQKRSGAQQKRKKRK